MKSRHFSWQIHCRAGMLSFGSHSEFLIMIALGDKKSIRFVEYEIHVWLRQKMQARTSKSLTLEGT